MAGFMDEIPVVQDLALSPSNELWVLRRSAADPAQRVIDVFDSSTAFVGSLPAGTAFPAAFIDETSYVAVDRDSLDVPRFAVFHIVRE